MCVYILTDLGHNTIHRLPVGSPAPCTIPKACCTFCQRALASPGLCRYYNTEARDGYLPIFKVLAQHNVGLRLSLAEFRNGEQPEQAFCDPERLLAQQLTVAASQGLPVKVGDSSQAQGLPVMGVGRGIKQRAGAAR